MQTKTKTTVFLETVERGDEFRKLEEPTGPVWMMTFAMDGETLGCVQIDSGNIEYMAPDALVWRAHGTWVEGYAA